MNMLLQVRAERIDSDCVFREATAFTSTQAMGSTGVLTFTIPTHNWNPGNAGDIIRIAYSFSTTAHAGADVVIETGTTDTEIVTSITEGAPPVSRRIFIGD
ncbi:hypothetical protein LCGC14_2567600, partial [marine sediment metagenome]